MKKLIRSFLPQTFIDRWHALQAWLAAAFCGFPARKLSIIGITGTDGKTSVSHYVTQLLHDADFRVGMLTTVAISIRGKRTLNKTKMTTLTPFALHRYLKAMVDAGCTHAVVETTSHALSQHRVDGIYYDVVVFTNLSHEHLDYHKTMTDYQKAKELLFARNPKIAIVNADDPAAPDFLRYPASQKFTFGILDQLRPKGLPLEPDIAAHKLKMTSHGSEFHLTSPFGEEDFTIPIPGRFTIANALAAISVASSLGVNLPSIKHSLAQLQPVEGRLEHINEGQSFDIIVDFAHTPNGLQQVYSTLRPMVKGKLIAVLGAAGNRDKSKRPILGALAGQFADYIIITNEDPGTEDPRTIIDAVAAGVPRGRPNPEEAKKGEGHWWWRVTDRREAIQKAISLAGAGDLVLITGKGGEHVMAIGDKLIPWNDARIVRDIVAQHRS